jgi:hypothetical protein
VSRRTHTNKPAKLRSWRVVIMRSKGEYLGSVEAPDRERGRSRYRCYAQDCLTVANKLPPSGQRDVILQMAQEWLRLAHECSGATWPFSSPAAMMLPQHLSSKLTVKASFQLAFLLTTLRPSPVPSPALAFPA